MTREQFIKLNNVILIIIVLRIKKKHIHMYIGMYKEGDAFVIKNIIINKYLDIQFFNGLSNYLYV